MLDNLTPKRIVSYLEEHVVGQLNAKKAVAIAMRNRYRRQKIEDEKLREEILPKNIIMVGPTGVGKTEIARRLSQMADSPFIKVEATKFTEVGYVGRDVDSMIRDLTSLAVTRLKNRRIEEFKEIAKNSAIERIIDYLLPRKNISNPLKGLFSGIGKDNDTDVQKDDQEEIKESQKTRDRLKKMILDGKLLEREIEIDITSSGPQFFEVFSNAGMEEMGVNLQSMMGNMMPKNTKKKKVKIKEAIEILTEEEANKLIDNDSIVKEALEMVENNGIVFIDELDKLTSRGQSQNPNVSREGVQRDLLPLVEGSSVSTKYGPVKTHHILFISAGAFHGSKPSDLIPELQGRFPIRVELDSLSKEDFEKILKYPKNALTEQYKALLSTEGVNISFSDDAISEIARVAQDANDRMENIGARRLYTIMEKLLEELSFEASDIEEKNITIDKDYVCKRLDGVIKDINLGKYIL